MNQSGRTSKHQASYRDIRNEPNLTHLSWKHTSRCMCMWIENHTTLPCVALHELQMKSNQTYYNLNIWIINARYINEQGLDKIMSDKTPTDVLAYFTSFLNGYTYRLSASRMRTFYYVPLNSAGSEDMERQCITYSFEPHADLQTRINNRWHVFMFVGTNKALFTRGVAQITYKWRRSFLSA